MPDTNANRTSLSPDSRYDVIVAGAGPVGLLLAGDLAQHGCSVLLLERAAQLAAPLKQAPFGIRGLNAPSIRALHERGLLDQLELHKRLKNPHLNSGNGANRQVGHFAGIPFYEGNLDRTAWALPDDALPLSLMSEMQELEAVLHRRAVSLGVDLRYDHAITTFQQSETEVIVTAGAHAFRARWLVGCDGARSIVRKIAGFTFEGTEPEFTGYSTRIDLAHPDKLKPGRNPTAAGMYLQSQPGYVIIQEFDGGAFHDSKAPITRAHVQEVLRRVSGTDVTVTALHLATTWSDRARQATSYRQGRVLLAGDAAHIHAPLGGQGLNLGIGDAVNLAPKLAVNIQRNEAPYSLDGYETERHPAGARVLQWSRAQVAIMRPDLASRALHEIIRDIMNTRDGATYFAGRVWGVNQ